MQETVVANATEIVELTREQVTEKLREFKGNDTEIEGVLLWVKSASEFISIQFGSGDNLSQEDYEEGYDSYVYITQFKYASNDFEETDGGMMLYKSDDAGYGDDICNAVYDALEFTYTNVTDFIPLVKE